jgi:nitroimidazol reductase NimA-like FMN-containing flavoprotein (pyridoxamine 5'-phosphate oxidase superfamily)
MARADTTSHRALRELNREEALWLLSSVSLGRIVFTDRALPAIRPVNHLVQDGQVVIRSHTGAAIVTAAGQRVVVAYEADAIDPDTHLGWSVVVTGVARLVLDPVAAARYREQLRPWVDGRRMDEVIAISPDIVTGFALAPDPAG